MQSLNCHKWGEGSRGNQEATSILALHGFTGDGLDFNCFVDSTADSFTWWAPDLMGHGKSPVAADIADYTVSAHIAYLDVIAKKIEKPFVLLGYSMGGRLALRYALERPELVSRLILVGASPGIIDPEERKLRQASDEALADSIIADGVKPFLKKWHSQPMIKTQENIPDLLFKDRMKRRRRNDALGLANSLRGMGTGVMEPVWDRLGEIKCPVTLITGEKDTKFCEIAAQMRAVMPTASHLVIPEVGHAAIWEDINYFNSWLLSMLSTTV